MTADSTTGYKMFGLGIGDSSAGYADIDFAWELQDGGGTRIYENGTLKYDQPTSYTAGDVFKVAVEYDAGYGHNVVRWSKNGTAYYTESSPSISYSLLLDTSIYTLGAKVPNAYLAANGGGSNLVGKSRSQPTSAPGKPGGATPTRTPSPTPRPPRADNGSPGSSGPPTKAPASPTTLPASTRINLAACQPNSVLVVNTLVYLHGDHLSSVSLVTSGTTPATVVSAQEFKPWGEVRSGGVAQTTRNYTGQQLDGTGLLYYHARYYDPALARFASADTLVPGQSDKTGTLTPQSLNRYTFVLNNPLRYVDPDGHDPRPPPSSTPTDVGDYYTMLRLTYTKMAGIVGGKDEIFNTIRGSLNDPNVAPGSIQDLTLGAAAHGLWVWMVRQDGDWDMKKTIRDAYGTIKNLYFDLAGKKDIAYTYSATSCLAMSV